MHSWTKRLLLPFRPGANPDARKHDEQFPLRAHCFPQGVTQLRTIVQHLLLELDFDVAFACIMGCIKSKQDYTVQNSLHFESNHENEEKLAEEKIALVQPNQDDSKSGSMTADLVLLDYAHRLSEEIVNKAVKQWAEVDSKYSDIPYIESDTP
ncbi:small membrane A-kinase anchor protein isoform X2 [Ascaphus truei]|uniref:small membrane A-kinase anchor protein isoform X2 n=1 Tax=Ascaphus truei TaxID=8439 RepID=UPI003F598E69